MNQIEAYHLLHKGTLALSRIEQQGIRVDVDYLKSKTAHLTRKIERMERLFKESKFFLQWQKSVHEKEVNTNSGTQLAAFLYKVKKLTPPKLTETGKGSTDKETLTALNIPELNELLQVRKLKKIRDTYLEGFMTEQVDGDIHPFFNLHLVRTYRSSADRPNLQNIPKRDKEAMQITRRALFPRPGHQLLEVDYSGLEVRIAACYHKDPVMLKYLKDGFDMHADMCKQIFKLDKFDEQNQEHGFLRGATKNGFVFPEFYGDYFRNCAEAMACQWGQLPSNKWKEGQGIVFGDGHLSDHMLRVGFKSLDSFTNHVKAIEEHFWGTRFRKYAQWKEKWWREYQKNGYIDMLTGFRCSGLMTRNDAINYPVQGAAFHCLLWSLIKLDQFLLLQGYQTRIISQIHDSLLLDVCPDELEELVPIIKQITCVDLPRAWDWLIVPLDVDFEICDVDASWADKKKLILK